MPRRYIYWMIAAVLVLGLGGTLGERLVSDAGLNPTPAKDSPAPTTTTTAPPVTTVPVPGASPAPVNASLQSFMGLVRLRPSEAPAYSLIDQNGQPATLAQNTGQVTVLTFFDGPCNDICPVLAAEIKGADTSLGPDAAKVRFVTVNTDPKATAVSALTPAVTTTGLGGLANWSILTGPLITLNSVWKSYGVAITLNTTTGVIAHNEVMYFIDPISQLRYRATPFANETRQGAYSLDPASTNRFAQGIAAYAEQLLAP